MRSQVRIALCISNTHQILMTGLQRQKTHGLQTGTEPKLGAVLVWEKHVCIVEEIHADGSITTSESGYGGAPVDAVPVVDGAMLFTIGNAEIDSKTVDLLTEPYASHLYNKWFDDYTGQVDDTVRPNRVLCDLFIDIPDDRLLYTVQAVVNDSTGQFICYFYDANENFLSSQTATSWVNSSTLKTIPNAKKLRVLMRLSSDMNIAIGNISKFKVLFI